MRELSDFGQLWYPRVTLIPRLLFSPTQELVGEVFNEPEEYIVTLVTRLATVSAESAWVPRTHTATDSSNNPLRTFSVSFPIGCKFFPSTCRLLYHILQAIPPSLLIPVVRNTCP